MSLCRDTLPRLRGQFCITDGELEKIMVFLKRADLPEFAAYDLWRSPAGERGLRDCCRPWLDRVRKYVTALLLEPPTWRGSHDRGARG